MDFSVSAEGPLAILSHRPQRSIGRLPRPNQPSHTQPIHALDQTTADPMALDGTAACSPTGGGSGSSPASSKKKGEFGAIIRIRGQHNRSVCVNVGSALRRVYIHLLLIVVGRPHSLTGEYIVRTSFVTDARRSRSTKGGAARQSAPGIMSKSDWRVGDKGQACDGPIDVRVPFETNDNRGIRMCAYVGGVKEPCWGVCVSCSFHWRCGQGGVAPSASHTYTHTPVTNPSHTHHSPPLSSSLSPLGAVLTAFIGVDGPIYQVSDTTHSFSASSLF